MSVKEHQDAVQARADELGFVPWFWKTFRVLILALGPFLAVLFAVFFYDTEPQERPPNPQGEAATRAFLLASCGAEDQPCKVGEEVTFRLFVDKQLPGKAIDYRVVHLGNVEELLATVRVNQPSVVTRVPAMVRVAEGDVSQRGMRFKVERGDGEVMSTTTLHVR